ncbi:MAG: DUF4405 domain-containing protein [Lachnospiraceae bacterium]|nr:DUF4405 domain-containing protein [Lachnospiraceae bacterium]
MKWNVVLKIVTDFCMTAVLIILMAYELVGQAVHEWLGIGMFVLFILHHIWNRKWIRNIFKRKHTLFSILQTILVICVFLAMAGSLVSGVILSRHALAFLPIAGGRSFARNLHMVSAYWGFVFLSLHLGFHWSMIMGMMKKHLKKMPAVPVWTLRGAAFLTAVYGAYAFWKRGIGEYMLLKNQFAFFDFEEPLVFFLADYIAVLSLFIWCGHYISKWAKIRKKNRSL